MQWAARSCKFAPCLPRRKRITAEFGCGRNKISALLISPPKNVPSRTCQILGFMLRFQRYTAARRRKLGLTRGMTLRAMQAAKSNGVVKKRVLPAANPPPRYCVQCATVQFCAVGPSAPTPHRVAQPIRLPSQWLRPSSDCIRYGRSRPACSASNQPVLRSAPDGSPSRKADAVRRSSDRPKTADNRSFRADNPRSQSSNDPDHSATATAPSRLTPRESNHERPSDATVVLVRDPLLVEVDAAAVHQAIARSARSGLRRKPDISAA